MVNFYQLYPSAFTVCLLTQLYRTAIVLDIDKKKLPYIGKLLRINNIAAYINNSFPSLSNFPSGETRANCMSI